MNAAERQKITRFIIVGVGLNLFAYLAFLALTALCIEPIAAMTMGYVGALGLGFLANRGWTFQDREGWARSVWKYVLLYLGIYGAQALLLLWAKREGFNLALFQLVVTGCMAAVSFIVQRLWVFAPSR